MEDLIKIDYTAEYPTVSARELHEALKINTRFNDWFPRIIEYGFAEGTDFNLLKNEWVRIEGNRKIKRELADYEISIDMAKQICMLQRTEKGRQYRQYFLDLEKAWNTPEQIMARALRVANREIDKLKADNQKMIEDTARMKPKEIFADAVSTSETSILIGDLAKLICQNGHQIGRKRLFDWMRQNGYLIKSGSSRNMPTQRSMEQKLFEVKESSIANPDGSVRVTRTTKVTGKGQIYFINRFAAAT